MSYNGDALSITKKKVQVDLFYREEKYILRTKYKLNKKLEYLYM